MLTARAFWITRRNAGLECGSVPPAFTATLISLLMRENALDMRSQRANMVCLRTSNMRPIGREFSHAPGGGVPESESTRSGSGIRPVRAGVARPALAAHDARIRGGGATRFAAAWGWHR